MASGEKKKKTPLLAKNARVSFSSGFIVEILDEWEKFGSRLSQISSILHHIG